MPQPILFVPLLVPGVKYEEERTVFCVDAAGTADVIQCVVIKGNSNSPAISARIAMPASQVMAV